MFQFIRKFTFTITAVEVHVNKATKYMYNEFYISSWNFIALKSW